MISYILGMKFSSFFLLACGAATREGEPLSGLTEIIDRCVSQRTIRSLLTKLVGFGSLMLLPLGPSGS